MNDLVSVILPVYNCEKYIKEAVDSLLNQTYKNLEIIIIDDCSTDKTLDVLSEYKDQRIKILENDENYGIVYSLNRGLDIAKGKYIARMDGDDICELNRIEVQLDFLKKNPDVIIASCWFKMFGAADKIVKFPDVHEKIFADLIFGNHLLHPGYFINADLFKASHLKYDERMKYVEDYDMAARASEYGKLANIPEVLINYRVHKSQTTNVHKKQQDNLDLIISKRILNKLDIVFDSANEYIYDNICFLEDYASCTDENVSKAIEIYNFILTKNKKKSVFSEDYLKNIITERMYLLLRYALHRGKISKKTYNKLIRKIPNFKKRIKLFLAQFR